ncbi:hypothetical protein ElyMa_002394300 [Elysia marginata]|uniref:Uncharacterized protein n=1 Tax=Elysia marginata TaxID=1093978 RepID=A0AAV4GDH6_9GAST|nr:hypothetical protein ElyMa_002394300 [Elysia marginata]
MLTRPFVTKTNKNKRSGDIAPGWIPAFVQHLAVFLPWSYPIQARPWLPALAQNSSGHVTCFPESLAWPAPEDVLMGSQWRRWDRFRCSGGFLISILTNYMGFVVC